uniref:Conserved plasma membrane protein n=1 Tax=Panagrellus redivivus TaxID=6233 RepID=A0A7E4UZL9_PANRE
MTSFEVILFVILIGCFAWFSWLVPTVLMTYREIRDILAERKRRYLDYRKLQKKKNLQVHVPLHFLRNYYEQGGSSNESQAISSRGRKGSVHLWEMEGADSPRVQKEGPTSPKGPSGGVGLNSPSGTSGKSKSSKFDEPRATTLNYEYQEQPTVKANLTASELKFLDGDTTSGATNTPLTSTTTTTKSSKRTRPDRNANRFVASILVMFTLGCFNMFVSSLYAYPSIRLVCGLLASIGIFTTYEWHRIHGMTLTRRLRPVLNMKSVFATYRNLDPDSACLYAADKDKFMSLACCNVPEINNELPRTSDEKSPPTSPPHGGSTTPTNTTGTSSGSADSPAVTTATETQSPANPDVIKRSTEINFSVPDSTAKDF